MMLESIQSGPLVYPTIEENGQVRDKKYAELTEQEKLQDDCDVQALNIVLQGLPPDVYALVNHCQSAKDIWDRVKLLMQGTELSYQERECKLYKEFDKFTSIKGESLHEYYLYPDPLALVANHQTQSNSVQYPQQLSSIHQTTYSSQPYLLSYEAPHHLQQYKHAYQAQISHLTPYDPQNAYHSFSISQQPPVAFLHIDSGLAILVFLPGDDPVACLNKEMIVMSAVVASRTKGNATSSGGNNAAGQSRVVKCYNFQGEGHMTRQYTKPKRPKNSAWFKEKMLLVQSQKLAQVLDEEQLAFLEDPGIPDGQAIQITIPQNAAFKTNDLDAYDYDCDDISSAKAVLMANLLSYDSGVLSEVVQIVLWYLDSECSKHMTGNRSQLINFVHKFLGTFRFINDQIAKIMGYGDYQMGKVMISRVYYVEGLGHNLFSVGQFYDFDLEVAFRKHTYYIRDLEDVDLLKGSRGSNLYMLSLEDTMLSSPPICLWSNCFKDKVLVFAIEGYHFELVLNHYLGPNKDLSEGCQIKANELITMASEQFSSGPGPQLLTPGIISSGLMPNPPSLTPYVPPTKKDWDILFQLMFDEYFSLLPSVASLIPVVVALVPADSIASPSSTLVDQDAPSLTTLQTSPES
ncbi:hypothetical protein Tco_1004351 [Tanacetum coccineum]|uniref:Retrovirus-related Pol polyprotein from transposon TNT 1-94-like beta-barrel domain-containing protein n=1 Tax=Tanacetum coccineum TaxID=301880 RepID=A0ABQ5FD04_9ASTR